MLATIVLFFVAFMMKVMLYSLCARIKQNNWQRRKLVEEIYLHICFRKREVGKSEREDSAGNIKKH